LVDTTDLKSVSPNGTMTAFVVFMVGSLAYEVVKFIHSYIKRYLKR